MPRFVNSSTLVACIVFSSFLRSSLASCVPTTCAVKEVPGAREVAVAHVDVRHGSVSRICVAGGIGEDSRGLALGFGGIDPGLSLEEPGASQGRARGSGSRCVFWIWIHYRPQLASRYRKYQCSQAPSVPGLVEQPGHGSSRLRLITYSVSARTHQMRCTFCLSHATVAVVYTSIQLQSKRKV